MYFPTNTLGMAFWLHLIHKKTSKNTKIHLNSEIITKIGFCALQLIITKSTTNIRDDNRINALNACGGKSMFHCPLILLEQIIKPTQVLINRDSETPVHL